MQTQRTSWWALVLSFGLVVPLFAAEDGLEKGTPKIQSAGPLAFGPNGVLFAGDPKSAVVFALDTQETTGDAAQASINIGGVDQKIASMLGTTAEQIQIQDMAVNPASGSVYVSVSRGKGPDATPVFLRVDGSGGISEFSVENIRFAKAELPNAPEDKVTGQGRRRGNSRLLSITDLAYIDGRVIVAGLSNEEFASNLRALEYPFEDVADGTSVEVFHGAHGRLETRSPIRTFVPLMIEGKPQIVAAYTCTPLVRFPLSQLQNGKKITGTTVAELGNRNRPLDIIAYKKDGKDFLLMANSARGMMKIDTSGIQSESVTERVKDKAGLTYDTLESFKNSVEQLDRLNEANAIVLMKTDGGYDLQTIALP